MPTIADFIASELIRTSKNWKSKKKEHEELVSDLERLKKNLEDIRKFVRTSKTRYSGRLDLSQLDQAVAALQLDADSLEEETEE